MGQTAWWPFPSWQQVLWGSAAAVPAVDREDGAGQRGMDQGPPCWAPLLPTRWLWTHGPLSVPKGRNGIHQPFLLFQKLVQIMACQGIRLPGNLVLSSLLSAGEGVLPAGLQPSEAPTGHCTWLWLIKMGKLVSCYDTSTVWDAWSFQGERKLKSTLKWFHHLEATIISIFVDTLQVKILGSVWGSSHRNIHLCMIFKCIKVYSPIYV